MDGFEVCRCLKHDARTRCVPVLMLTALRSDEDQQQARAAGADGFLAKPFDSAALLARVRSLIDPA
jgi:two-component system cell cycle response regulator